MDGRSATPEETLRTVSLAFGTAEKQTGLPSAGFPRTPRAANARPFNPFRMRRAQEGRREGIRVGFKRAPRKVGNARRPQPALKRRPARALRCLTLPHQGRDGIGLCVSWARGRCHWHRFPSISCIDFRQKLWVFLGMASSATRTLKK